MPTPLFPVVERRASLRIRQRVPVLVTDAEDVLAEPYAAWVVDASPGGVCLSFHCSQIAVGAMLAVQHASASVRLRWHEVRVKNCRRKEHRVELGCEFVNLAAAIPGSR